jgi:hypothetical protein
MAPMPVTVETEVVALGWTGQEVLVIGSQPVIGARTTDSPRVALAYSPDTDRWRTLPLPEGFDRDLQVAQGGGGVLLWSGSRIIRYGP